MLSDMQNRLLNIFDEESVSNIPTDNYFAEKRHYVKNFKSIALLLLGTLSDKFERDFLTEQEILSNISDVIMLVYGAESTFLRVEKLEGMKGEDAVKLYKDILDVYVYDAAASINKSAKDAINSFVTGEEQQIMLDRIDLFTHVRPVNVKEARRRIADKLIDDNKYNF